MDRTRGGRRPPGAAGAARATFPAGRFRRTSQRPTPLGGWSHQRGRGGALAQGDGRRPARRLSAATGDDPNRMPDRSRAIATSPLERDHDHPTKPAAHLHPAEQPAAAEALISASARPGTDATLNPTLNIDLESSGGPTCDTSGPPLLVSPTGEARAAARWGVVVVLARGRFALVQRTPSRGRSTVTSTPPQDDAFIGCL